MNCKLLNIELFTRGHFVGSNATHYFARAERGIWAGVPYNWMAPLPKGWVSQNAWAGGFEVVEGEKIEPGITPMLRLIRGLRKVCFYLGKFPVYWSQENFSMVFADQMIAGKCYAVGKKPFIVGVDMSFFEALAPARRPIYFKEEIIKTYARQAEFLSSWAAWQGRCRAGVFAPEPIPKRYVKGVEWPSPMSKIKPPTPEPLKPPETAPKKVRSKEPKGSKLHLEMTMGQSYAPNPDKLIIWIELTEISPAKELAIKLAQQRKEAAGGGP